MSPDGQSNQVDTCPTIEAVMIAHDKLKTSNSFQIKVHKTKALRLKKDQEDTSKRTVSAAVTIDLFFYCRF